VNLQYYLSQKIAAPNLCQLDRDERAYYRGQVFRSNQLNQFLFPIIDYQRLMAVTSKHMDITRIAKEAFTEFWREEIDI
jgi:hypothetical protein